jgi:hypothetical protein
MSQKARIHYVNMHPKTLSWFQKPRHERRHTGL